MPTPPTARPGTSHSTDPPVPIALDGDQQQRVPGAEGERGERDRRRGRRRRPSTRTALRVPTMYGTATAVKTAPEARGPRPRPSWRYSASTRKYAAMPVNSRNWPSWPAPTGRLRMRLDVDQRCAPATAQRDAAQPGQDRQNDGRRRG